MRGPALRRDHVIAAGLAGAVVVVVGYASGLGLRPGTAAATPPVVADGGHPVTPQTPGAQPLPAGQLPTGGPVSPLPAIPVGNQPADPIPSIPSMPSMPGDSGVVPAPDPGSPEPGTAPPPPVPPPTTPIPPPPGPDVPACQAGVPQQVLDTVGGLPLLGAVTTGLGVTGPTGVGALVLGYCRTGDGGLEPAMVPAATTVPTVPSGR
ncbi:hypothetical protein AMES_4201 [Amycolatopsis mediterranei S699]|uniref:Uncharacterized protein n=2 Tax=Amycolatopsis mediterranei TaxID=33910 RepID=A0A0H3D5X5_AMYMU|nr:hypothetical protein [Amycolatopsis mediterranei]ADJ46026.1 hypothetical protein AMED_4252 [Amycolatopsis mediterranei U32]AEK42811.1 hypothetical protein RAM_21655 [Amycolatopsis mediterranei S699]AFO77737.1 hypothetical protein AMES_4201 [Amycolatopsis mediterranei S699]AGT84865.1 hypothetical protein B737_4201 [Amycolatopsis mediterranei RB]KDO05561.1 hypothetical protein DV26_38660 [Amycolatopsis mediterranei]